MSNIYDKWRCDVCGREYKKNGYTGRITTEMYWDDTWVIADICTNCLHEVKELRQRKKKKSFRK